MILSRRKGLYNQVANPILCTPLPTTKKKQIEPRQKQTGSTSENLCYMCVQKVSQLIDLNEKRDGAATTWYGSSFHIKGQFRYLQTSVRD